MPWHDPRRYLTREDLDREKAEIARMRFEHRTSRIQRWWLALLDALTLPPRPPKPPWL